MRGRKPVISATCRLSKHGHFLILCEDPINPFLFYLTLSQTLEPAKEPSITC